MKTSAADHAARNPTTDSPEEREFGLGIRVGYGLEGIVAAYNTGTMYLQIGLVRQSQQYDICPESDCDPRTLGSAARPRVPSRGGLALELRLPFWLIPGDLLVLAPVLALTSPSQLTRVAVRAASGGLIPWQRTFATSIGYIEFVAGRVVSAKIHGLFKRHELFAAVFPEAPSLEYAVRFRALQLLFPLVEYTPFRVTAQSLTASWSIQLAYAIDIPFDVSTYFTDMERPGPHWDPAHMFLLCMTLNGRGYL